MSAVAPARFVKLRLFEQLSGYTVEAVETKIKRGIWLEGHEYVRAPDRTLLVDIQGYEKWAANQRRAG